MAQRIVIPVLGGTLAPYGSAAPRLQGTNISENWHVDVTQLERGVDTTATVQALYPNAKSYINIVQTYRTVSKHSKAMRIYTTLTASALDALAG